MIAWRQRRWNDDKLTGGIRLRLADGLAGREQRDFRFRLGPPGGDRLASWFDSYDIKLRFCGRSRR